jgi:tetratricopeptide (TPR) repeat protein
MIAALLLTAACGNEPSSDQETSLPDTAGAPVPPAATGLVTRAEMAIVEGQYVSALRGVTEAIRRAPHFARAHHLRAQLLTRMDSLDAAREALENVRSIDPEYPAIHFYLGNNAVQRRQFADALEHYRAERSRVAMDHSMLNRTALSVQIGNVFRELGQADSARATLLAAIALDESSDIAYDALGQIYQEQGELETALEARAQALKLNPNNGSYAYHVGSLLYQLGKPAEAIDFLEQSRQRLPWFYGSYYNLGRSKIALGRLEEGQKYLALADSLQERQGELGLAKARAEARGTPGAWIAYADMLRTDGRLDEALQAYLTARALDPLNEATRIAIAQIQAGLEEGA